MDFQKITEELWRNYFSIDEEIFQTAINRLDENCSIIGTGAHEVYSGLETFRDALIKETEQRESIAFQFRNFWCRQQDISPDACLVYGGLDIWWENNEKTVYIDMPSRYSILYQKINGEWKVTHLHQSVPNQEQADDEYYPKKLSDQVEKAQKMVQDMADLVLKDSLTDLYNFRGLESIWNTWNEKDSWILVIDLDDFKTINDTYGHLTGNEVLKRISAKLSDIVRSKDIVCRMGGDEFIILCSNISTDGEIAGFTERIMSEVKKEFDQEPYTLSLSIGITFVHPGETLECVISRADEMLYAVKKTSKNSYRITLS